MEKISPAVLIDGYTVYPEGWMIVLAFALRDIPWAIAQCLDVEFDLKGKVRDYYRRREVCHYENYIADLERKLTEARERVESLRKAPSPSPQE